MYPRRSLVAFAAATLFALPAFTQTNFQYQAYATPNGSGGDLVVSRGHVADFNGDGFADVLSPSGADCSSGTCKSAYGLTLYLNNGSGGLEAGRTINVFGAQTPAYSQPYYVTFGDFNGDGKLDIAALHGSGLMSILYGNGDGTFAAPVISQLASGTYTSFVEADFDANGTQDLAALNQNGQLVMMFNNGKGSFTQQTVTLDTPPSGYTTVGLEVGDFNGDGRPDLAWAEELNEVSYGPSPIMSALNTAKGVFSVKKQVGQSSGGFPHITAADLDLDGKTDLIIWTAELDGCCSGFPQTAYYSNGDGTFTSKELGTFPNAYDVDVADINGDGNPDVLMASPGGVEVFTGNGNRTFTDQGSYNSLPGGAFQIAYGFFTGGDAVGFAAPNGGGDGTMTSPNDALFVVANDNAQGNCPYPTSPGVTFCSAVDNDYTVTARGTARAQTQPVKEIQLWANGQELYHVESDEFNATLQGIAPGAQITAVEVEANGTTRSTTVTPTLPNPCPAPSSPGVNFCTPKQGETLTQNTVEVMASGTGASGTVNHLELWIDGTKQGNYNGNFMQEYLSLTNGPHALTVIEVDSKGAYIKSNVVDITVTSGGGCGTPASPGVNVCSPLPGATSSSPVAVVATGLAAKGATVNHLELWIDGSKQGVYTGASMDASVPLAAGSHAITVIEVDSKGNYIKSNVVNITVKSGSCQAPSTPGVNVCSPAQGATVGSPVTIVAAGEGTGGQPSNHMELWIDGGKIGNYPGAMLNTSVSLAAGKHAITVIEDATAAGDDVKSNVVNITVK